MIDSYLHPRVVSFINYFYDYIHKEDPNIMMDALIRPNKLGEITIYLIKCINGMYYNATGTYSIEHITNSSINPEAAKRLLDKLQKEGEKYGKNKT